MFSEKKVEDLGQNLVILKTYNYIKRNLRIKKKAPKSLVLILHFKDTSYLKLEIKYNMCSL